MSDEKKVSRRDILKMGTAGAFGVAGSYYLNKMAQFPTMAQASNNSSHKNGNHSNHANMSDKTKTTGYKMAERLLTEFDYGNVTKLPNGQTLREYEVVAIDKEIEIAKGIKFPGWTYNGTIPGPSFRCTEGDLLRFHFINQGSHPHSIHFHGIHPPEMDGLTSIYPGQKFTYEFEAKPYGLQIYHCHVLPLARHIHKGLYGNFIIDPKKPREPALELNMVMNGFDLDLDGENEFYTVNGYAFAFMNHPIKIKKDQLVRIYLSNLTEFDLLNSFHLHANYFTYYPTGRNDNPSQFTDTIMQCQGERGIIEVRFPYKGTYMFHAHVSEFAELGWMGFFEVE
ncbi:Copper-containing nitrite reductase [Peribacillus frigoritolerans]|uniref:multicopper oxidase domain-containing protein n=1 Tax=Peribacillus frigoritolerans TaxID=450367 RepID=UPI000BAC9AED|nr:multicopper oxidase domain-containing protein [Peribacillus frigoritolerans]MED3712585.1 multicopper oxidase domain-containing protein [Peribacillus frigoritolerans]PAW28178.1 copper oxidase [Peribacillus simplex]CAH0227425.1 Copper-containing nitrite reductase [Peribacillus frigoritolerans]